MRQLSTLAGLLSTGALSLAATACGPSPVAPLDAQFPDAAVPDAVIVHPIDDRGSPCDAPMHVVGTMGSPSTVMLDTSMTDTRPNDLGLACGNVTARRWARQQVIEYVVPGTGPMGVRVSTANMGTDTSFNTVLQIRRECGTIPTQLFSCFDDVSGSDPRTEGGFSAMGGETVYIYVTGYSEPEAITMQVDEGQVRVTLEAGPNTAPTLTSARYLEAGSDVLVTGAGHDGEGNVAGLTVFLYNAAGRINLAGAPNGIELRAPDATGMDWSTTIRVPGSDIPLVDFCARTDIVCTGVGVVAFDQYYAASAERMISIEGAAIVGLGDTCDTEHVCGAGLVCNAGMTCEPTPAAMAACGGATVIVVPTPTTMATVGSATTTVPGGASGTFTGPAGCATTSSGADATAGPERLFRIDVPAGTYDLTVGTDRPGTGSTDTVLYMRAECGDPTDNLGCMDDINTMSMMYGSRVTVMNATEGDYYAFVETFGGGGGAVEVQATLRPVLAMGAACDPAGVQNRCAAGACPAGTMVCP
ncbi:MAG: hypothetical protein K1X94_26985 [Sandaracinaceae bacterium]|nr:hypothetical protein [Sandaracinaceae bacterium]